MSAQMNSTQVFNNPNLPTSFIIQSKIRDDFNNEVLNYKWNTIRTPKEPFWSLTEKPGFLRLRVSNVGI